MSEPQSRSRQELIEAMRASGGKELHFPAGALVQAAGEDPASTLLIIQGTVRIFLPTTDGSIECGFAVGGDIAGLGATMAGEPSEFGVQAVSEVRVVQLSANELRKVLNGNASLYAEVAVLLSRSVRSAYRNLKRVRSAASRHMTPNPRTRI